MYYHRYCNRVGHLTNRILEVYSDGATRTIRARHLTRPTMSMIYLYCVRRQIIFVV